MPEENRFYQRGLGQPGGRVAQFHMICRCFKGVGGNALIFRFLGETGKWLCKPLDLFEPNPIADDEMEHNPRTLQFLVEAAAPPGKMLTFKPMFGAILVSADGKAFATLAKTGIGLKLDQNTQQELLALAGAGPFQYAPNCPAGKNYVKIPEAMLEDSCLLSQWLARSADFVQTIPVKRKARKA